MLKEDHLSEDEGESNVGDELLDSYAPTSHDTRESVGSKKFIRKPLNLCTRPNTRKAVLATNSSDDESDGHLGKQKNRREDADKDVELVTKAVRDWVKSVSTSSSLVVYPKDVRCAVYGALLR